MHNVCVVTTNQSVGGRWIIIIIYPLSHFTVRIFIFVDVLYGFWLVLIDLSIHSVAICVIATHHSWAIGHNIRSTPTSTGRHRHSGVRLMGGTLGRRGVRAFGLAKPIADAFASQRAAAILVAIARSDVCGGGDGCRCRCRRRSILV